MLLHVKYLNCLVLNDESRDRESFPVKVPSEDLVAAFKKAVKEEMKLWKVCIAADSISAEIQMLSFLKDKAMDPLDPLSILFSGMPTSRHLHIVIQHPESGKLSQAPLELTKQASLLHHMLTEEPYVGGAVSALHKYLIKNEQAF